MSALRVCLVGAGLLLAMCGALVAGCGGSSSLVVRGPMPEGAPSQRVAYPPPPAKVEFIPLRRRPECRFRDGYFTSEGGAWIWKPGLWVVVPENCYYAPPETNYESTSAGRVLVHRPGGFFEKEAPHRPCVEVPSCDESAASREDPRSPD